jgi:hypothetical protein
MAHIEYKDKYLELKKQIMNGFVQYGSGKMNPLLVSELSDLSFVVGDNMLGDDVRAIIMSLIDEFNHIATNDLKHNYEISQFYAVDKGFTEKGLLDKCDNCEIVLKYIDSTICLTNGMAVSHFKKINNQFTNKPVLQNQTDCEISRGLIRFYIKQQIGNTYTYTKINIVKVKTIQSFEPFLHMPYQNNEMNKDLENKINIAISKGQSEIISDKAFNSELADTKSYELETTIKIINSILKEIKKAAIQPQLSEMRQFDFPTQSAVDLSQVIAKFVSQTNIAKNRNLTTVLIPGESNIPIGSNPNIQPAIGIIGDNGIEVNEYELDKKSSTVTSKNINLRASIAIDANVAIVDPHKINSHGLITIVSKDLSVLVPNASISNQKGGCPYPQDNESNLFPAIWTKSISHHSAINRLNAQLAKNSIAKNIDITKSKQALAIVNSSNKISKSDHTNNKSIEKLPDRYQKLSQVELSDITTETSNYSDILKKTIESKTKSRNF